MSYKVIAINNTGTSTKFGGNDLDADHKLFNGVITGVPPVTIKSQNKFGFWDGILFFRNQADSRTITIRGPSSVPSTDVDLELPPITANDTLAAVGVGNAWNAAQKMESGVLYKAQTEPATPAAGYFHLYVEGGHLKKKNPSGGIIDYDNVSVGIPSEYDDQSINIKNPAGTFHYTLQTSAITANRKAIFPILTGDDTFAFLNIANIFTQPITVKKNAGLLFTFMRDSNAEVADTLITFDAKSSTNVQRSIAQIDYYMIENNNGDEDGSLNFGVICDGQMLNMMGIDKQGFYFGETNFRGGLSDAGLTDFRMFTFPDVTTKLAGLGVSNIFTELQEIQKNSAQIFNLYRPTNTVSNGVEIWFYLQDSANNKTDYSRIRSLISDNTDGSEDGIFRIQNRIAGSMQTVAEFTETGDFIFGLNQRGKFVETLLTALRSYSLPNVTASLVGAGAKSGATTTISNTTSETDMLNYSVAANQIGANGFVRFRISGYILQNQATGTTFTFKIKFGGTVMWEDASSSIAQTATKLPFIIEGVIFNKNATNAQGFSGSIRINDTAPTTGIGDATDDETTSNANIDSEGADTTKDTTLAQTLQVTVTQSVANANVQTVIKHYSVEVIT